jgi:hypothetical protein
VAVAPVPPPPLNETPGATVYPDPPLVSVRLRTGCDAAIGVKVIDVAWMLEYCATVSGVEVPKAAL